MVSPVSTGRWRLMSWPGLGRASSAGLQRKVEVEQLRFFFVSDPRRRAGRLSACDGLESVSPEFCCNERLCLWCACDWLDLSAACLLLHQLSRSCGLVSDPINGVYCINWFSLVEFSLLASHQFYMVLEYDPVKMLLLNSVC